MRPGPCMSRLRSRNPPPRLVRPVLDAGVGSPEQDMEVAEAALAAVDYGDSRNGCDTIRTVGPFGRPPVARAGRPPPAAARADRTGFPTAASGLIVPAHSQTGVGARAHTERACVTSPGSLWREPGVWLCRWWRPPCADWRADASCTHVSPLLPGGRVGAPHHTGHRMRLAWLVVDDRSPEKSATVRA
jgi:hypothetical protein